MEAIVTYKAKDYTSINQKTQQIYLYNEAEIQYKDMDIKAGIIIIDYGKDIVYAGRLKDSTGITLNILYLNKEVMLWNPILLLLI